MTDDGIKRDRYGRYLLPDPETGKLKAWTRATTIAGTLKDRFGLEQWDQRNIVYGIGQRQSLYAKAAAATLDDRKILDGIARDAKAAANSKAGADIGSALHAFTERVDRGEELTIPEPFDADVKAYTAEMEAAGILTLTGWIERVVICHDIGIVGTMDRLSTCPEWKRRPGDTHTLARVGDIKTAIDKVYATYDDDGNQTGTEQVNTVLRYGMADIPLQLAIYANASHWWNPQGEKWVEMPPVDRAVAMVYHVPAGMAECRIIEVDIAAGWEAVQTALKVRAWRKRKGLGQLVTSTVELQRSIRQTDPKADPTESGRRHLHSVGEEESVGVAPSTPAGSPNGGDEASSPSTPGKGGESGSPSLVDPPAPLSPPVGYVSGDVVLDESKWCTPSDCGWHIGGNRAEEMCPFHERYEWLRDRINAIKTHPEARARLARLWSLRDEIPTFPKGGPRDSEEISVIAGLCSLVEMEASLPFGEPDPHPDKPLLTPAERSRAAKT
jgi:hypothetical protein